MLVKRANPVLRDVDRLFGILSAQRDQLAQLASDSDEILRPLARERAHVAGFFTNAGAAAQASSERGAQLEESLRKFPTFLREFRLTMRSLQGFSDAATPVFADFGKAAPVADRRDPDPDPVLGGDDGGAEEPRRRRRSLRPDLPRSRPGRAQGDANWRKSGVVADRPNWRSSSPASKRPTAGTAWSN